MSSTTRSSFLKIKSNNLKQKLKVKILNNKLNLRSERMPLRKRILRMLRKTIDKRKIQNTST